MEIKKRPKSEIQEQKIQLVDGEFTPSQASDIIMALINQKINYHKIESLQNYERNHKYDQEPITKRVDQLVVEKKKLEDFISKMREEGKNLKVDGILTLKSVE